MQFQASLHLHRLPLFQAKAEPQLKTVSNENDKKRYVVILLLIFIVLPT